MTTRRLTLVNAVVILTIGGLFLVSLVLVRGQMALADIDAALRDQAQAFAQSAQAPSRDTFAVRPIFFQAVSADRTVLVRSSNLEPRELPLPGASLERALRGEERFDYLELDGHTLRGYTMPMPVVATSGRAVVAGVVMAASPVDDLLPGRQVALPLVLGLAAGALTAVFIGGVLAHVALAPIKQLATTVRSIESTEDLARRVPLDTFSRRPGDPVTGLAIAVNSMLGRLEEAAERIDATLRAQRQFVADASHELRTPLTSLRGNVQLLTRFCAEDCPALQHTRHEEILDDLQAETERMARLVDGLLALARADAEQHLTLTSVELEPLLHQAVRAARAMSEDVTLQEADFASGVRVLADPDRLLQLVLILLDNALRYTPAGGRVQLAAVWAPREWQAGVAIEVTDSGPGVPAHERSRIFERFYRSSAARRVDGDGVGLGLAVARWIAQEHHAEISVLDAPGGGSVFRIWLPSIGEAQA